MIWNLKLISLCAGVTLLLCAGSVWYGYSKGKQSGMQEVQTLWNLEKLEYVKALATAQANLKAKEQAIQAAVTKVRQETKRDATRLVNDYAAVINSLHDRPTTRADSTGLPEGTSTGVGCTGKGLARPDAEFLARYAREVVELQLAYRECKAIHTEVSK